MKTKLILTTFIISHSIFSIAQTESSAFTLTGKGVATPFATDYHSLGINPANLDLPSLYEGKKVTIGFAEIAVSLYSEALTKEEVRQNLFNEEVEELSYQEQIAFAQEFASTATAIDADVMAFGFALKTDSIGGFGFSIRDRAHYYSELGPKVSEIGILGYTADYFDFLVLMSGDTIANDGSFNPDTMDIKLGYTELANALNIRELIEGTHVKMSWTREFNFGYGKLLLSGDDWGIYAGVGLKYLLGYGMIKVDAEGGEVVAFTATSPIFDIDYSDEATASNPSSLPEGSGNFTPVGKGLGFDLGLTYLFDTKYRLSAAITDIGGMTWDGNLYTASELPLLEYENGGIESIDFVDQLTQLNGSDGILQWEGASEYKTKLPTAGRIGFGYQHGELISVGVDLVVPLNDDVGSLKRMSLAIGGDIAPVKWLRLSLGVLQGGNYDFKIPAGVTLVVGNGTWEGGVASRDMVTFFTENQPTLSLSTGFLRFRF
ncbi:MAG: DUF5723 family protein [Flavobacteriales bacterium]|nr:DUF5723 family protein [Flavobacteriales bacterium]